MLYNYTETEATSKSTNSSALVSTELQRSEAQHTHHTSSLETHNDQGEEQRSSQQWEAHKHPNCKHSQTRTCTHTHLARGHHTAGSDLGSLHQCVDLLSKGESLRLHN